MVNSPQHNNRKYTTKSLVKQTELLLSEAKKLIDNGFWIVPTIGKISQSKNDKNTRLSYSDFEKIVIEKNCNGLGILTNVHTNYLSFDLDTKDASNPQLFERRLLFELENYPTLKSKIKLSQSPSGGYHLYILVDDTSDKKTFIGAFAWSEYRKDEKQKQTVTGRSIGQYCCEFPTPNYKWIIDNDLQVLTDKDKSDLKTVFSVLNEDKDRQQRQTKELEKRLLKQIELRNKQVFTDYNNIEVSVWEDFNNKNSVHSILENNGFTFRFSKGTKDYYLRNGSTSKTSGFVENSLYVNFSDNAGLPTKKDGGSGRKFSAFDLTCFWSYGGDYSECSKDLISKGYGQFKPYEKQQYKVQKTTSKTSKLNHYTLNENQYISDVLTARMFDLGLYSIKGGTGTGKTYFVALMFSKCIVVSRNVTTLENYSKYGFTQFLYSQNKDGFSEIQANGINKITVTYKSFKKLRETLNLDGYVIVFDEAHLLNESYKDVEKETKYCYYSINELSITNTVILMSANVIHFNSSNTTFKSKFYFKKPSVSRSLSVVYNASFEKLKETILKRLQDGKRILLFTNRTEQKILSEVIKTAFPNKSLYFFDGSKHGQIDLGNLTHDITVTTSALVTGKDVNNSNLSVVFYGIDRTLSVSTIVQFFGRARDYKTATFDLLFEFKNDNEKYGSYSDSGILTGAYLIAKSTIDASVNDWSFLRENKDRFVTKNKDGKLVVDWFNIDNYLQRQISKHTVLNTDVLSKFLGSHGYSVTFEVLTDTDVEKQEKLSIVSISELYDLELNEIEANKENETEFLTNVYNRFMALQKVGFDRETALNIVNCFKSKMLWKRFIDLLIVECSLTTNDKAFIKVYNDVLTALNDFLTASQVIENVGRVKLTKAGKKTELGRIVAKSKRVDDNDIKTARSILKKLRSYYSIEQVKRNNKHLFKHSESDYLQGLKPILDNVKNLYKYNDLGI